jgi:hypothetical protein
VPTSRHNPALAAYALAQTLASNARHGRGGEPRPVYTVPTIDTVQITHTNPTVATVATVPQQQPAAGRAGVRCEADTTVKCDDELARIVLGLRQAAQLRLWLPFVESARHTGLNYITRAGLMALLDQYHVKYSRQNFNRWLREGHGLYWRLDGDGLWLIGYERLAKRLVQYALDFGLYDLVSTNIPGMRKPVYIDIASDNLSQFEANCYSAWHTSKGNVPISRFTLRLLFNRSTKTLIHWQRLAGMTPLHNFVHYSASNSDAVPLDRKGELRGDVLTYEVKGRSRWSAEYSNSYQTPPTRMHDKRGKARRVFSVIRQYLETVEPVSTTAQGSATPDRLHPTKRYLFDNGKRAKSSVKRYGKQPRAVYKGMDNRRCRHYEYAPGGDEQMRFKECADASRTLEGS